ncbi:hypothetical protein LJC26_02105 [Desulfovibrio sp. OttesenSCG-928-O18]|nr:hypothetical protein [Desulfovibrio sp. OttesenSCG-928-O18]
MWRRPRNTQTTIPCKHCKTPLVAERSCRCVTLSCPKCRVSFDLSEYKNQMDDALEDFMGQIPCDRI